MYLVISYTVSIYSKDYNIQKYKKILKEHTINTVTAPTVDIYLPCYKEPIKILENIYKHI